MGSNLSMPIILIGIIAVTLLIIPPNFMTKDSELLDAYNAGFATLTAQNEEGLPTKFKTTSRDKEWVSGRVLDTAVARVNHDGKVDENNGTAEVFNIASITKTFSAVAVTKVATSQEFAEYFDREDPLGTNISQFEKLVEKHGSENEKRYIAELKASHPDYEKITLRNLLNHTSGIHDASFMDEFRQDQSQSFRFEDGKYFPPQLGNFAEFSYSNQGYEVAALMAKVVASEVKQKPVKFTEIVRQQVTQPLNLSHTFMPDEMVVDANDVQIANREDIHVAQGYDYYKGKVTTGQDFNYDVAAGGIYSTAEDVAKFYQAMASEEVFKDNPAAAKKFFAEENFVESDSPNNKKNPGFEKYGLGTRRIVGGSTEYLHHGGSGVLSYSHALAQRTANHPETATSGVALLSYENLTRPIATRLLGDEKKNKDGNYFIDEALAKKMDWLAEIFTTKQLINLRKELENSPEKFEEKFFEEFQRSPKPTANPVKTHTEKMVGKTLIGSIEV